jgi:exodeoxyribonuclease V alpha subunit
MARERELKNQNTFNLNLNPVSASLRAEVESESEIGSEPESNNELIQTGSYSLNLRQSQALRMAKTFKSFCLIGAAGTGKTTVVREIAKMLSLEPSMTLIESDSKMLKSNQAGIFCCSFTNIAVQNIASQMEGAVTCSTIHSMLEFMPIYLEEVNPESGKTVTKRIFEPARGASNPLPNGIKCIIIEESGVVGARLYSLLLLALPNPSEITFIFLGDLYQLPPVFDNPILGQKLLQLPIIELNEVYRQALESPILDLAHKIKDGKQMPENVVKELSRETSHGKLTVKHFQKKTDHESALHLFQMFMKSAMENQSYTIEDTMILIPYNVNFGCIEANKIINHLIDIKEERTVYEVISGFNKLYFATGDIIYSKKRKAKILEIKPNPRYIGKMPAKESKTLDRWGFDSTISIHDPEEVSNIRIQQIDSMLEQLSSEDEVRKTAASHLIEIEFLDKEGESFGEETLDSASELNELIGGYALTVHKAQGSEWNKGICWFHNSHSKFINRELLYTAVTRFKKELLIICEKDTFIKGINNQALKGRTLAEKLESLKMKMKDAELKKF